MNQKENLTKDISLPTLILTGEEKWASFRFFRGFPQKVQKYANACGDRYALFCYYVNLLKTQLHHDIEDFLSYLNKHIAGHTFKKETKFVAYYHGVVYLAALYGSLISLKSLFDNLTQIILKLLKIKTDVKYFKKGKINGKEIAGGDVVNVLRNNCSKQCEEKAEKLARVIEIHSEKWITQAVRYRDAVVHEHEIPGIKHMRVILISGKREYSKNDILMPEMEDGIPVIDYCQNLLRNLECFLRVFISILHK